MSDFLFASRRRTPGSLRAVLESYLGPVCAQVIEAHGEWGSLAVVLGPHDARVLEEDERFLTVLVGEPIVHAAGSPSATPRVGDRRRAAHTLLCDDRVIHWDDHLDGMFAALVVDKQTGVTRLLTDLAAFVPVFAAASASGGGDVIIGTHVDCVARAAERHHDLDLVSVVDLVVNLRCTFPYTIYHGVEQIAPATVRTFGATGSGREAIAYWAPIEDYPYATLDEAAGALREGFATNIATACAPFEEVGLLLSGGEDSRAVLGAVPRSTSVDAFVYADWENREVRVARTVARAYGAKLHFGGREPDHYLDGMLIVAPMVGSQHLFMDVHSYGFHARLGIQDRPLVLGGYSSDSFLKALYAPSCDGRQASQQPFRPPVAPAIRHEILDAVVERRTAFRRWLAEMRPESAAEWELLWPCSMLKGSAHLHGNRRLFVSHEPYLCAAVVKLAAGVPLHWKRHRALFYRAMRPFFRPAWYVPHASSRFPIAGRWANLPLGRGLRVGRLVRDLLQGELHAPQGPWPQWRTVVTSRAMQELKRQYSAVESPFGEIFASASTTEVDATVQSHWPPLCQLMLLQLTYLTTLDMR